jgi:hypothetical protein
MNVCHSNTPSEFGTHSELMMGPQHSLQQPLDITLPVFEILPTQNALTYLIALFEYTDVKNIPPNLQLTTAPQSLTGVSIVLWFIAIYDVGLALFI